MEFTSDSLAKMREVVENYRVKRDADFGSLILPENRGSWTLLRDMTNYHARMLATVLPELTTGQLAFVFKMAHDQKMCIFDEENVKDNEAWEELLGVLLTARRLAEGVPE